MKRGTERITETEYDENILNIHMKTSQKNHYYIQLISTNKFIKRKKIVIWYTDIC